MAAAWASGRVSRLRSAAAGVRRPAGGRGGASAHRRRLARAQRHGSRFCSYLFLALGSVGRLYWLFWPAVRARAAAGTLGRRDFHQSLPWPQATFPTNWHVRVIPLGCVHSTAVSGSTGSGRHWQAAAASARSS